MKASVRRLSVGVGIVIVLAAAAWFGLRFNGSSQGDRLAVIMRGKTLYGDYCASCHGQALEGQPQWRQRKADGRLPAPPHDASGHTWHHSDAQLFALIKQGLGPFAPAGYESDMPAFAGILDDDEIRAILAYIKSEWPPDIRARQDALNSR